MRSRYRIGMVGVALVALLLHAVPALAAQAQLASAPAQERGASESAAFEGVVEAVRQTVVAAQVQGAVIALEVQAGDAVRQGQVLLRIDAREALQNGAASEAQVQAARSALEVASRDYARQRQLLSQKYISQAAFDRYEAQFRATSAQLKAQVAQAGAAHIQSNFYVVRAPYTAVVAEVPVMLGDMAMPGRPLLTLYDPARLRVTATLPQSALGALEAAGAATQARVELPALPGERRWLAHAALQVLPTIDAGTHSAQVRVDLPPGIKAVVPGMFARVWLPSGAAVGARVYVPASALVRRAEMTGLYVLDGRGRPLLRQVRLGRAQEGTVEVLSGVHAGERVALDPQAAAKVRP